MRYCLLNKLAFFQNLRSYNIEVTIKKVSSSYLDKMRVIIAALFVAFFIFVTYIGNYDNVKNKMNRKNIFEIKNSLQRGKISFWILYDLRSFFNRY